MFERFTASARAAVVQAQGEARALTSPRIGAEHVLLGVLATEADSPLGRTFVDNGLTADVVRADLASGAARQPLGEEDAEALRTIGIDLDAVRESVEATFGTDALDLPDEGERRGWLARRTGHIPFTASGKKALELSLREAVARKDGEIRAEHLVLGLLRGAAPEVVAVITPRVAPADLRRQVGELLDRAA